MSVPRIVVNETLEIKRIAVTAEGQNITVTIAEAAAGVSSVNGQSDVVVLSTDDITEGVDNLYYTDARVTDAVSTAVDALTTDDITEGSTNKYYTDTRVTNYLANNAITTPDGSTITNGEIRAKTGGYAVITNQDETKYFYVDDTVVEASNAGCTWTFGDDANLTVPGPIKSDSTLDLNAVSGVTVHADDGASSFATIAAMSMYGPLSSGPWAEIITSSPSNGTNTWEFRENGTTIMPNSVNIGSGDTPTVKLDVHGSARIRGTSLTVDGDLIVNGTTTTLNTETLAIEDNIIVLNSNVTGTPTTNAGIEIERGTSTNSALTWNESTDKWEQNRAGTSTVIAINTDELSEGSTNKYYTDARSRGAVSAGTGLSYDNSTGVFTNTITQYTDALARAALSGGTGVTYNSSTGSIAIGQSVATSADVTFNSVDANITDSNFVTGQLLVTRNTSWTAPTNGLTSIAGQNGIAVSSSNPGSGNGYTPSIQLVYYSGDTTSGTNSSASLVTRGASGTNASPTPIATNQTAGTWNFDGMSTNGWAGYIATTNSGAGTTALSPLQIQGYAVSAFTDSAGTVTNAPMALRVRGFPASTNMTAANRINFIDHSAATATYKATTFNVQPAASTTNYMSLGASTGHVSQDTFNIRNNAGTTTYGAFTSTGTTITGAGLHQITRTTVGTPGVTESRPSLNIQLTRSDQAAPSNNDGTSFRYRVAGSNGTNYTIADLSAQYSNSGDVAFNLNLANGDQTGATFSSVSTLQSKITNTVIRAGTASGTAGGSSVADKLTIDATKITAAVPVAFPVYTAAALRAVTGSVGWQACVSNSASGANPNGMMAFWDTTNNRWSYVHDNSAV